MTTKYQVTDSRGQVHKRTSKAGRVYTHAVVTHYPACPAEGNWAAREAYSKASWSGSLHLAHKEAARRSSCVSVEVIPV